MYLMLSGHLNAAVLVQNNHISQTTSTLQSDVIGVDVVVEIQRETYSKERFQHENHK